MEVGDNHGRLLDVRNDEEERWKNELWKKNEGKECPNF